MDTAKGQVSRTNVTLNTTSTYIDIIDLKATPSEFCECDAMIFVFSVVFTDTFDHVEKGLQLRAQDRPIIALVGANTGSFYFPWRKKDGPPWSRLMKASQPRPTK